VDGVDILHYVDKRFDDHDTAARAAYSAMDDRLRGMNELRSQFSDLLPRAEFEARHADVANQIGSLVAAVAVINGKNAGTAHTWALVIGIGAVLATLLTILATGGFN